MARHRRKKSFIDSITRNIAYNRIKLQSGVRHIVGRRSISDLYQPLLLRLRAASDFFFLLTEGFS